LYECGTEMLLSVSANVWIFSPQNTLDRMNVKNGGGGGGGGGGRSREEGVFALTRESLIQLV